MIYYILLMCVPFVSSVQSIAQKQYTLKNDKPNVILFSAVTSFIALCFFLITSRFDLQFDLRLVPYALGFAIAYASAWVGTVLAVKYGLMAISTLIVSCSLVFPVLYGVIMGEAVTAKIVVGIALLFAAIVLVNLKFDQREKGKFSLKWLGCVMVAFLGNGACSVMSNMQKRALGDGFKHEFMIIALSAAVVLLAGYAFCRSKDLKGDFKKCLPFSTLNGTANAALNLITLTLIGNIPNTVLYPTSSALNMIAAFLLAAFIYKEKFSKQQYVGYALGIASIVLLNI